MNRKGAPNKYETHVKPQFENIKKWLQIGATEKEIAERLGITKNSFISYKKKYLDLFNLIKNNRKQPVEEIKAAMLKRALGFQYEEKKVITQIIKFDDERFGEIPAKVIKTEVITKTALPDVAAGLVLLKHWDKESGWSSDPQTLELKKQELELKKQQAENENW